MTVPARGPSAHLSWRELACKDVARTPYPVEWRLDRAVILAVTFEDLRALLGDQPLAVHSAYRTVAYNRKIGGARASQHCEGRAIDFTHPTLRPREIFIRIRQAQRAGHLPLLGGLGLYRTFVHVDVRPRIRLGYLAMWSGTGITLPKIA
jgi:hypothetical protein